MNYLLDLQFISQMKKLTNTIIISSLISILTLQVFGSFAQSNTNSSTATDLKFNYLNPQKVEVLNSEAEESMPIITSNGQELYFIRTQVASKKSLSKSGQEIWVATKNGDTWGSPQKEDLNINDLANNAVIGTSADGKTIYLFNSIETRHKLAKGLAYISKDSLGKWGEIKKLTIPGFEVGDGYYAFYVTSDENTILVSAALDTMAYEDIYVSEKIDGNWTPLKNLGSNVNTSSIETSPFISEDKKTLYFSSAGHGGFGETDLFKSIRTGIGWDEWSKPINLGNKINSPGFDAYLVVSSDEKRAYFSSNRKGKHSDIFYVADFGKIKLDKGKLVRLSFDNVVLSNETIEIYNDRNELIKVITTDEDGAFEFEKIEGAYFRIKEMNLTTEDLLVFIEEEVAQNDTVSPVYNLASLQNTTDLPIQFVFNGVIMANETVELLSPDGQVIGSATTDENGRINQSNLRTANSYRIGANTITDLKLSELVAQSKANSSDGAAVFNFTDEQVKEYIVYFDFDKSIIKTTEMEKLDDLIAYIKDNGKIELSGHTDYKGAQSYNLILSDKRVKAVNDYLIDKGLDKSRIISKEAKGELIPIAENSTIIGRAINRRVEIRIKN
jgi:outer membrane protein OmpA-like peptidoglycan-associated protein